MLEHRIALSRNGRGQTIEVPSELALPGTHALLRKEGGTLVVEPLPLVGAPRPSLIELLRTWEPIDDDIGPIEDPLPGPVDL